MPTAETLHFGHEPLSGASRHPPDTSAMGNLSIIGIAQRLALSAAKSAGAFGLICESLLNYEVTLRRVPLSTDFGGRSSWRVLHLSDLHLDGIPDDCVRLRRVLSGLHADVCVMTGDYVDPAVGDLPLVRRLLQDVIRAAAPVHGVYAVLGDHDPTDMIPILDEAGVRLVGPDQVCVAPGPATLKLVGVAPRTLAPGSPRPTGAGPLLCLAHTPDSVEEGIWYGAHYYLCGHTHGGQVCLPNGWPIVTRTRTPRSLARGVGRTSPSPGTRRGV